MAEVADLRSVRARRAVVATARRLGLYDARSMGFRVAYLLAESPLLPEELARASRRTPPRVRATDAARHTLAAMERAGWVVHPRSPQSRGRPLRWTVTERGRIELEGFTEGRAQATRGRHVGWARYFLALTLCQTDVDEMWSTPDLVAEVQRLGGAALGLRLPAETIRKELPLFERREWVARVAPEGAAAAEPWLLSPDGVRALRCLARRPDCPLPRTPRRAREQDLAHDLRAARAAATLLPYTTAVGALTMGRQLNFDPARLPFGRLSSAGYCRPDVAATVVAGGRRRLVCVEVERRGSLPNLERHVGAYAAFAASWVGQPSHPEELLVMLLTSHRVLRRDAVERLVAALAPQMRDLPWRIVVVGPREVRAAALAPFGDDDSRRG